MVAELKKNQQFFFLHRKEIKGDQGGLIVTQLITTQGHGLLKDSSNLSKGVFNKTQI